MSTSSLLPCMCTRRWANVGYPPPPPSAKFRDGGMRRVCKAGWPVAGRDAHGWHNLRQKEIGLITDVKEGRGRRKKKFVICAFSCCTATVMGGKKQKNKRQKTSGGCSGGGEKVGWNVSAGDTNRDVVMCCSGRQRCQDSVCQNSRSPTTQIAPCVVIRQLFPHCLP